MPTIVAFGHGKIFNNKLSLHILKRILHIAAAQLAMLSIGFYLLSPFLHMHGSEHEGHGEQVCVEDFCTLEEHQESFEYCHEDTHLFCELCDWQQPVLSYFSITVVSVDFVPSFFIEQGKVVAPETDSLHSKKGRAPPSIC